MITAALEDILNGKGPLVIVIFALLLFYFAYDIIKKINRAATMEAAILEKIDNAITLGTNRFNVLSETIRDRIDRVSNTVTQDRNLLNEEIIYRANNTQNVNKMKDEIKELQFKVITLESEVHENKKRNQSRP